MKYSVLDIGGTFIKASLMDENGAILEKWKVKSDTTCLEGMLAGICECIEPHAAEISGIAISMPGKINTKDGIAETGGAFKFVNHLHLGEYLTEKFNVPVTLDNDGKCAAQAELWLGALKGVQNGFVYILGTGIGGGLVINGAVYRGSHYSAGELSCLTMDRKDINGPINGVAGDISTATLLMHYMEKTGETGVDGIEFFKRLEAKEPTAVEHFDWFCKYTARYLFDLQIVLDVDRIAIGGGISAQPILVETIRKEVETIFRENPRMPGVCPEIVTCQFENDANLVGALKTFLDIYPAK